MSAKRLPAKAPMAASVQAWQMRLQAWLPVAALVSAISCIQLGATLAKQLFPIVGAWNTTTLRLSMAAGLLLLLYRPWRYRLAPQQGRALLVYGSCLAVMNTCFYLAIERIPLGIGVALEFCGPLSVALLAPRDPQQALAARRRERFWALLATVGIAMLLPVSSLHTPLDITGVAYALLAAVGWAGYILSGQRAGANLPGGAVTAYGLSLATLCVLPYSLFTQGMPHYTWRTYGLAGIVAILSSALPYSLEMFSLQKLSVQKFGILMSLEPALATLGGLIFLHEQLSFMQGCAVCCIMLASAGSALAPTPD